MAFLVVYMIMSKSVLCIVFDVACVLNTCMDVDRERERERGIFE